jgi:hypothetical protein
MKSTSTWKTTGIAAMALMLTFGVATSYGQNSVHMRFSGTSAPSTVNLQQPDSTTSEYALTGTGDSGRFDLRLIDAQPNQPSSSSTCSGPNKLYFQLSTGGGVFRFQDGSLLYVQMTQGSDCIDFAAGNAFCTRILQITGGTGRYKSASGMLTLTETVTPVLADSGGNPVFFAATGQVSGTLSGVSGNGQGDDGAN